MHPVLTAALPIFALILMGFFSARIGAFDRAATDAINRFAVYLALPALMFMAMTKITPEQLRQYGFAGAFGGGMALAFAAGFGLSRIRGKSVAHASIEGLDAGYANVGFMGIPLCLLVFGPDSLPAAIIATLLTACVLFLFSITLIELDLHAGAGRWRTIWKVTRALFRNPLLIAPAAGLAFGLFRAPLPAPLATSVTLLADAASPAALICIGLFLAQERFVGDDAVSISALVVIKLLAQPAATALLALYVFDAPPLWARAAILLAALPIGSGPFTIAKLYGLEAGVTSGAILASHVVSVLTVSLLVAWLA